MTCLLTPFINSVEQYALKYCLDRPVVDKIQNTNDDIGMKVTVEDLSDRVRKPPAYVSRALQVREREEEAEWREGQGGRDAQQWNEHTWTEYGNFD